MTVTIELIEIEGHAVFVVPSRRRIDSTIARARRAAADAPVGDGIALAAVERLEEELQAQAARYAQLAKPRAFEFRPYTFGDKLEAKREAQGAGDQFDSDRYALALMQKCYGLSRSEIDSLDAPLAAALAEEMFARCEPLQDDLDFFLSKLTSSGSKPEKAGAPESAPNAPPVSSGCSG